MKSIKKVILICLFVLFFIQASFGARNIIAPGGDVFIGEQGLDISACMGSYSQIAWFASGTNPNTDAPNYQVSVGDTHNFYVAPATFVGRTGNWYRSWGSGSSTVAFTVIDPSINIKVWDNSANKEVSGKSVSKGHFLNFRVETNTYTVTTRPSFNPVTDGFVTIKVKTPYGDTYTSLWQSQTVNVILTNQAVDSSLWYWVVPSPNFGWNTGVMDNGGAYIYNDATYTVSAELNLNGIKNNYKAPDGTDYTGKTVSTLKTVNINSNPTPTPTPRPPISSAVISHVAPGGDVFIGEQNLDVSSCAPVGSQIAWFASGTNPSTDNPNYQVNVGDATNFYVAPATFIGRTGNWYRAWGSGSSIVAFTVVDPSVDIKVWDNTLTKDVTGKSVVAGDYINFRIETNTYSVASRPNFNPATQGFVTILLRDTNGAYYSELIGSYPSSDPSPTMKTLIKRPVDKSLYYWVEPITTTTGWNTAAGNGLYSGTYVVSAYLVFNNIIDNYKAPDGSDYTGKTKSPLKTITISGVRTQTPTPTPSPTPSTQPIQFELYPGWNYISCPRILIEGQNTAGNVFTGVNTDGHSIYTYDAQNSIWKKIRSTDIVQPLDGIWVYSTDNVYCIFYLVDGSSYPQVHKQLYQGWNSIGFYGISQQSAKNALFNVKDQWSTLIGYDASKQLYETSIVNNGTGTHSDSLSIKPMKGYWVSLNGPGIL